MKKHILFTLICAAYILITSIIGTSLLGGEDLYGYESSLSIGLTFLQELGLVLMIVYYVRRYSSWSKVGYGKINWRRTLWILPVLVPALIYTVSFLGQIRAANPGGAVLVAVVMVGLIDFMVGFAEETLFRGILLRGEMEFRNIFQVMLVSSVAFGLFHLTNLAFSPVNMVLVQVATTFLVGLFYAPLALLVRSLWPLVIFHFLWDFVQEAPNVIPNFEKPASTVILIAMMPIIEYAMIIVGWTVVFIMWRRGRLQTGGLSKEIETHH